MGSTNLPIVVIGTILAMDGAEKLKCRKNLSCFA
jgi:hypothetical protein